MAVEQRWPVYRGWWCTRIEISGWILGLALLAGIIEGDLPNQVAVSTGSTVVPEPNGSK